ncbi:MAG TPA: thiamine phosphate synthase [Bryobacteraceae bacterium]|nr:thiamine phosphate synthase [Bryobacteraceae bacterium]
MNINVVAGYSFPDFEARKKGTGVVVPDFYPIVGGVEAAEAVLEAGARIVQFRHKQFFSREVFEDARRIANLCRSAGALFVVNDRADIAMLLGAGLHLGQDDLPPAEARRLMPAGSIIGFSTHNESQLRAADREPVDYLAIGPIFATGSKQNPDPVVGVEELRRLRALTNKPLIAIGGITRENALAVFEAGADSIAVIGDLSGEPRARAEEWMTICSSHRSRRP